MYINRTDLGEISNRERARTKKEQLMRIKEMGGESELNKKEGEGLASADLDKGWRSEEVLKEFVGRERTVCRAGKREGDWTKDGYSNKWGKTW